MKPNKYNYNNQSGMYRHKILIRKRIITTDDLMQEIDDYEDYGSYWAMVKTLKGNELMAASQEQFKKTTRFVIKYSKSLDEFITAEKTSFEIKHKGVTYDVKDAINDDELNETVTILAEGRV